MAGKQPEFLTTKVLPPRAAPGLIERPRLLGLTGQLEAKRLAVIRGGAGFGKTSLAVAWAARLRQSGHAVAWLALDADDSEPTRFLFCLAQALRRACSAGEASLRLISDVNLVAANTIAASLINELAEVEEDVFLILDDYQLITDDDVHATLAFLLRHAPSQFHLVLATRSEPPLPLATLRAQNQLLEVDPTSLRFDAEETRQFLELANIATEPGEAKVVQEKTEGWPALLRIFASTLARSGQGFVQSLRGLSGTVRPIGAYLEEMLAGQPSELVEFMVRTAILDRLSPSLCEAVTGVKTAAECLDAVAACQLLLAPLDQEGRWFRYHPILAEYLGERLTSEFGDEISSLHRRAYQWYAAQELWTQAVKHAIAAGDTDQAVSWIKNCAMSLVKQGDLLTLMDWLRLFPAELMRSQLEVRIAIAWGMALAIRLNEALEWTDALEEDIGHEDKTNLEVLRCECQAIRSVAIAMKDESHTALALAEDCLRRTNDPWTANVASNVARFGHLKAGDLKSFYETPWIPYSQEEAQRNLFAAVYRQCLLGIAEFQQLRLPTAERHYFDGLQLAEEYMGRNSIAAALPASLLAQIRYEQGRLDEAEALVIDRMHLIAGSGMLECVLSASLVLVRVSEWRGNRERAYGLLEQAETLAYGRHWDRLAASALTERVNLFLSEGRDTEAGACADRLERLAVDYDSANRCASSDIRVYAGLARARLALAQDRPRDAVTTLKALYVDVEAAQNRYGALRVGTQLAIALFGANEPAEAIAIFRGIAVATASAGIRQMLLEPGAQSGSHLPRILEALLRTDRGRDHLSWVQDMIARWRARYDRVSSAISIVGAGESLSARERAVLELIGEGQSNKKIARTLEIAPETVKSHVKNIFMKLTVETRTQAVTRAQSLGLVRTEWQLPAAWSRATSVRGPQTTPDLI
jgi:LuxR family transcriptional regulator, maltose regulon positive regulatory protein